MLVCVVTRSNPEMTRRWWCMLSSSPCIVPVMNRLAKTHTEHRWQHRWHQQQHKEAPPPTTSTLVPSTMVLPSGPLSDRDFGTTATHTTQCTTQHHAKQQHQQSTTTVDPQIVAIGTVHLASTMVPPTMPLHSNIIPTVMFER